MNRYRRFFLQLGPALLLFGFAMALDALAVECPAWTGVEAMTDLRLDSAGTQRSQTIQAVRDITGLGLQDSTALVDKAPTVVLTADQASVQIARQRLTAAGAGTSLINPAQSPGRRFQQPFFLPIEDVFTIGAVGAVATGTLRGGIVRIPDRVRVIGMRRDAPANVTLIDRNHQRFDAVGDAAYSGQSVGLALRGRHRDDLRRGMAVVAEDSPIRARKAIRAEIRFDAAGLSAAGINTAADLPPKLSLFLHTIDVQAEWFLPDGVGRINLTTDSRLFLDLDQPLALWPDLCFPVRVNGRTIGTGVIREVFF